MKRKMARNLLTYKESSWEPHKRRGKLDSRSLFRVCTGTSKDVFRKRVESEAFDTCVVMMVDHSGSMGGYKIQTAAQCAIAFGEILNQLDIPFSVFGFSTGNNNTATARYEKASLQERNLYSRWGDLWIGEYKSFDESWQKSKHNMIDMYRHVRDNTYDGESVRYGANVLLSRPEKRKILFWLNDGQPFPNSVDNLGIHTKYIEDSAKLVESNVELFAIGIGTDAVKRYYKDYVVVNNFKDLTKEAFRKLDKMLRRNKVRMK